MEKLVMHLKKLGRLLVLELLNRENETELTFDDVVFKTPTPLVVNEGIRNTSLTVSHVVGSNYREEQTVKYWRLDIGKIVTEPFRVIPGIGVTSTKDIVNLLNDFYDLALDQEDIIYETIDTTTLPVQYKLKTNSLSYAYIGTVDLELSNELIPLRTVVRTNVLDDYLTAVLDDTLKGNVIGAINGELLDFNSVQDVNFSVAENGEIQTALAVATGTDVNVGPNVLSIAPVMNIQVAETGNWVLLFCTSLLTTNRLADDSKFTEFVDTTIKITHPQSTLSYVYSLQYDILSGNYAWLSDKVNTALVPQVVKRVTNATLHHFLDMEVLLTNLFGPYVTSTDWSVLGTFEIEVKCAPRLAGYIKPIIYNFTVNATV
jgi:hypothetical protein